jgi:hypothetical protein
MEIRCPKGHLSTDADYCSECGAKIADAPSGLTDVQTTPPDSSAVGGDGDACPDCGTRRANPSATFCEVCRYNFVTKTSWAVPPVPAVAPPALDVSPPDAVPPVVAPVGVAAPPTGEPAAAAPLPDLSVDAAAPVPEQVVLSSKWEAVVQVDPALYVDPDPEVPCPTDEPERVYHLDFAENLIGRRSDRKDIHPEVHLRDPGVSHRHAKLLRQPDGSLELLDVGSTNGTRLNGQDVQEGVKMPLKDGDEIVLGCWTRILLRETRS